ncbi:MAG: sulfate permease [Balneolaceae bacterium]
MNLDSLTNQVKDQFTIFRWLPEYSKQDFKGDLRAGLTVGLISIPQVMAYAVIAGLSPIYGLYGSLIPLFIYPLFGTSKHLAVGLVATDMIIIASGASMLADPGTGEYVSIVLLLTMFTGLVHMGLSLLRMGFLVNLLSKPVIFGFMAAAPLIIVFSQFGNLLGFEMVRSEYVWVLAGDVLSNLGAVNYWAFGIGLLGIGLLIILKKLYPLFPRAIVLLVGGGVSVWIFNLQGMGVDVIGSIPSGLPSFRMHDFTPQDFRLLLPTTITLVLIQLMTVMSLGKTFANKYKYPLNPNREFFAIGAANFMGSFFQSPPVSGSFSRSAVNDQSGARSALSNVVCAVLIIITLLFLTPLFYFIPIPALAAIIIVASLSLINFGELRYLYRTKPEDAYIALFTFFSVLFIGIQEGILLGIGGSLLVVLYHSSRPNMAVLGHVHGSRTFRDVSRNPSAIPIDEILILRFDSSISFNNAEFVKDFIIQKSEEQNKKTRAVVVDAKSINDLDTTAIDALQSVAETLYDWDIELHFGGLKTPVRKPLLRSGLARRLGGTHFHESTDKAVQYLLNKWDRQDRAEFSSEEVDSEKDPPNDPQRLQDYLEDVD